MLFIYISHCWGRTRTQGLCACQAGALPEPPPAIAPIRDGTSGRTLSATWQLGWAPTEVVVRQHLLDPLGYAVGVQLWRHGHELLDAEGRVPRERQGGCGLGVWSRRVAGFWRFAIFTGLDGGTGLLDQLSQTLHGLGGTHRGLGGRAAAGGGLWSAFCN